MYKTKEVKIEQNAFEKISNVLGKVTMNSLTAVKEVVNPSDKPLKTIYLASGKDVAHLIAATGATEMILVDWVDQKDAIKESIKQIGGNITKESSSGNRTEAYFDWNGKSRKLIFYILDINNETVNRLSKEGQSLNQLYAEMKGIDVIFTKYSNCALQRYEPLAKVIEELRIGDYYISCGQSMKWLADSLSKAFTPNCFGFEEVSIREYRWADGGIESHLYRKMRPLSGVREMLEVDGLLFSINGIRNGMLEEDVSFERARPAYKEKLEDMKRKFDELSPEVREELKQVIVNMLIESSGNICSYGAALRPEYNGYIYIGEGGKLVPTPEMLLEFSGMKDAQHGEAPSADVLNEWIKELEERYARYLKDRREDFREVFKEWFSQ